MTNEILHYYAVGFTWKDDDPASQLPSFISGGVWESGYEDKYASKINSVPLGARLAAKTTFTRKKDGETISILEIHATGTVVENPEDGRTLKVKWDKPFKPFELENKGAYRATISRINQVETIKLIFSKDAQVKLISPATLYTYENFREVEPTYPCFVFNKTPWDDFGYKTNYMVDYLESPKVKWPIGDVKILINDDIITEIPEGFIFKDEDQYCSLGQSNQYYLNLRTKVTKEIADYYLDTLNDVAIHRGIIDDFENKDGFKTSIVRSSEAQKACREGNRVFRGIFVENIIKFTFSTRIGEATEDHSIMFDYSEKGDLPFRIKVLIGKNGTGKTRYLSNLASTLSGYEEHGKFSNKAIPPFSRVIAVSYSLFDKFPRPAKSKNFSYYYCGFQGGRGLLTDNQIETRLKKAFDILKSSDRIQLFGKYLSIVLSEDLVLRILDEEFIELNSRDFRLVDSSGFSIYSSGQVIMILILAEILAYITHESLLVFDEPETHLHPNSISLFIDVIGKILNQFNSYAVISTHSPQIIQEVPSKDIKIVERIGNTPSVRPMDMESFGENLNTITERIFHTINHDEFYRKHLIALSKEYSYEEVLTLFETNSLPLSFGAKIYLQSLYQ